MKKKWYPYLLILPVALVMVLLYGYPILLTLIQSFNEVNLLTSEMTFTGLQNYIKVFNDPTFYTTLGLTFKYTVVTVFLKVSLGFLFAYLLNSRIYARRQFRFMHLIPWAIPQVAVATLWQWILDGEYGYLNYFLTSLGLIDEPIAFLSNPTTAFYATAFVDAWLGISLVCLMFLSGLQSINPALYEAAEMDGAGSYRKFKDITIPGIKKVFTTVLTLVSIWTFNSFNVIFVLTQGGPMRSTETLMIRIYQEAFSRFDIGLSSTLSVISFLILTLLTLIYMRGLREDG